MKLVQKQRALRQRALKQGVCFALPLLLCLAGNVAQGQTPAELYQQEKVQIESAIKDMGDYDAADSLARIQQALELFKALQQRVQQAEQIDQVLDQVTETVEKMALIYEEIAEKREDIFDYRRKQYDKLADANGRTLATLQELEVKKQSLLSELTQQREKQSYQTGIEQQKLAISIRGNESLLNSVQEQQQIWRQFNQRQQQIRQGLEEQGELIDLFLHVLNINAQVYREAANVAWLRRSARDVLLNLSSLTNVQPIIQELQNSWAQVDTLVNQLGNERLQLDTHRG